MSMPNIWGDPGRLAWGWIGRVRCASRESARRRRGTNDAFVGGVRNCADAAGTDMHAVLRHHMPDVGVRRVHVRHVSGVRPADARQTTAPVASTAVIGTPQSIVSEKLEKVSAPHSDHWL